MRDEMSGGSGGGPGPDLLGKFLSLMGLAPSQHRVAKMILTLVLLAAGVLLLENMSLGGSKEPTGPSTAVTAPGVTAASEAVAARTVVTPPLDDISRYQQAIGQTLQHVLAQMAGVGAVDVTVTLAAGPSMMVHEDIKTTSQQTETTDAGGGKSTTVQTDTNNTITILRSAGGTDQPVVLREQAAEVAGVLVVADGAKSFAVQLELTRAVAAALGVSPSRVHVLPRGGK